MEVPEGANWGVPRGASKPSGDGIPKVRVFGVEVDALPGSVPRHLSGIIWRGRGGRGSEGGVGGGFLLKVLSVLLSRDEEAYGQFLDNHSDNLPGVVAGFSAQ